jgi:glycosyltransferase involved in cell wall biosynthesis
MLAGGSERVISLLANEWAACGHDVTILALAEEHRSHFILPSSVRFRCLGFAAGASAQPARMATFVKRLFSLRHSLRDAQPQVIVAFTARVNTLTLLSSIWMRVPVVVSERVDPAAWRDIQPWQFLRSCAYPLADAVVSQTKDVAEQMGQMVGKRSIAIPNPVPPAPVLVRTHTDKQLIGCGRLTSEKRFDRLIDAFLLIHKRHPAWSLTIAGEGEMRPHLEKLIVERGPHLPIRLSGAFLDPRELFAGADLFALTSEFEGFPNVLTEAMAHGLPVVSFDCRSGPSEIVRDGVDGFLIPDGDVPAMAAALDKLMSDGDLRQDMGKNAQEISQRFSMKRILSLWDDLFDQVGARVLCGSDGEMSQTYPVANRTL